MHPVLHDSPLLIPLDSTTGLGNVDAEIKAIYHSSQFYKSTSETPDQTLIGVLLDKTNFYAESGGQECDTGRIVIDGKADFYVEDVQVFNGYVLHIGTVKEGTLSVGDKVVSSYDEVSLVALFVCKRQHSLVPLPSSAAGPFATTTLELTSSTTHSVRSSVTTSTKRDPSLRPLSSVSTSRTSRPSPPTTSPRLRASRTSGLRRPSRSSPRRWTSRPLSRSLVYVPSLERPTPIPFA